MLKTRIFVSEDTDVEREVRNLEDLVANYALGDSTRDALIAAARSLISDFKQTAIKASSGQFKAEIFRTLKGTNYEIAIVLGDDLKSKSSGIMRFFKR